MFSWFTGIKKTAEGTTDESEQITPETPASSRTRSRVNRKAEKFPPVLSTTVERTIQRKKVKPSPNQPSSQKVLLVQELIKATEFVPCKKPQSKLEVHFGLPLLHGVEFKDLKITMAPKDDLTADIASLTTKLTRITAKLATHNPTAVPPVLLTPVEVEIIDDDIKAAVTELNSIETRTHRLYTAAEVTAGQGAHVTALDTTLTPLRVRVKTLKAEYDLKQKSTALIKREALPLPRFGGESSTWAEFKDQFEAAFHNDTNLSPSVKLQNLKNLMIPGSAPAQLMSGFSITDANYPLAYKALNDRYEKTRELVFAYVDAILDTPTLSNQGGLQNLIDTVNTSIQKIQSLGIPTGDWGPIIARLIYRKLDPSSRREIEKAHSGNAVPPLVDIMKTLEPLAASYECTRSKSVPSSSGEKDKSRNSQKKNNSESSSTQPSTSSPTEKKERERECLICHSKDHWTCSCDQLKQLSSLSQRIKFLRDRNLCERCATGHATATCKRAKVCTTRGCFEIHNQIVCPMKFSKPSTPSTHQTTASSSPEILPTVVIEILDNDGNPIKFRGLIDGCSQLNLISESAMSLLRTPRQKSEVAITGPGVMDCGRIKQSSLVVIRSLANRLWNQPITFHIQSQVARSHPQSSAVTRSGEWNHLLNIPLADPTFNIPGKIDFILSSGVYARIKRGGIQRGSQNQPIAEETELGWIVMGETPSDSNDPTASSYLCECDPDFDLTRFWDQEEIPSNPQARSDEDIAIEAHFVATHTRDADGRYVVELPFISNAPPLGNSESQSLSRFLNKEKGLNQNSIHKELYAAQINQLIDLDYLFKVHPSELHLRDEDSYYVPHHGVFKESSSTTKLRIVLDCSMKTSSGFSLNDVLMSGPTLQPDMRCTFMKFRTYEVAFTADIQRMYHQVKVASQHQNFLRILWRENLSQPVAFYKLGRVPFGAKPSSFLAVRCLHQLVQDEGAPFPLASSSILTDFYMDDCGSGGSLETALQLSIELRQLLAKGGFHLTKWTSNDPRFLESIPAEDRATESPIQFEDAEKIKTLGISWNPLSDSFSFHVEIEPQKIYLKRDVVSIISRIFDPTGWIQPIIVPAKLIIQEIWKTRIGWKEPITPEVETLWGKYLSELPDVQKIQIPRRLMKNDAARYELHAFSDASKLAYGAAVYLRAQYSDGSFSSTLVSSKSRITPLSSIKGMEENPGKTIPRLELCGALIAAQLIVVVQGALRLPINELHLWTDSSITLWRLNNLKLKNNNNIVNKIQSILQLSTTDQWHYVSTKENPADILSRGSSAAQLKSNDLWWFGPKWLLSPGLPIVPIPGSPQDFGLKEKLETKTVLHTSVDFDFKRETFTGLLRASALIRRGIQARHSNSPPRASGPLTPLELQHAELLWVKKVQLSAFPDEICRLSKGKPIRTSSSILKLSPLLMDGILRVGGRLDNSNLPEDSKHQIILPKRHTFTHLLIRHYHYKLLHAGTQQTRYSLLARYWILQGHSAVKKVINDCLQCFRHSARPAQQLMGELPDPRVNLEPVFSSVGIDFAGPLYVTSSVTRATRHRPKTASKVYIAVFVCMCTKLIHLELVTGLSTELFLAALSRFSSIWGYPGRIYSDNGSNFIGANNELKKLEAFIESTQFQGVVQKSAQKGTQWIFNPPSSPHQGGLWEAAVKSVKLHLKRIVGERTFTFEELSTLLARIQGILNSRPLYPLTADQTGRFPLTPAHFYLGRPLTSTPEPDLIDIPLNRLNKYQEILRMSQHFRQRFKTEYLSHLQRRSKWESASPNLEVGQFCLLVGENESSSQWATGEILEVHPGRDSLVRKVTVKTETGIYQRPVVKIIPLPQN